MKNLMSNDQKSKTEDVILQVEEEQRRYMSEINRGINDYIQKSTFNKKSNNNNSNFVVEWQME